VVWIPKRPYTAKPSEDTHDQYWRGMPPRCCVCSRKRKCLTKQAKAAAAEQQDQNLFIDHPTKPTIQNMAKTISCVEANGLTVEKSGGDRQGPTQPTPKTRHKTPTRQPVEIRKTTTTKSETPNDSLAFYTGRHHQHQTSQDERQRKTQCPQETDCKTAAPPLLTCTRTVSSASVRQNAKAVTHTQVM